MLQQKSDERILGDSDFVESVQAAGGELLKKRTRYQQQEVTFATLVPFVVEYFGVAQGRKIAAETDIELARVEKA